MNPKTISMIGLGLLAYEGIFNNMRNRAETNEVNKEEQTEEFVIPGVLLNEFISSRYKISFKYPKAWVKNPRYQEKYEGKTGFFEITDFSGQGSNIDQIVNQLINEPDRPYGTNPTVKNLVVDGQPARLIYPSADQNQFINDREVALVVQYKNPDVIQGMAYPYVIVWATREYMPLIASTFKFI